MRRSAKLHGAMARAKPQKIAVLDMPKSMPNGEEEGKQ